MAYDSRVTILHGVIEEDQYESECETAAGRESSLQTLHDPLEFSKALMRIKISNAISMQVNSYEFQLESKMI